MEPIGATASILGIVSFGLGLAKSLQTFIDSVIEAEETITLIVAEVNSTASTLKDLQDFIDQDKAVSKEQHQATVFSTRGIEEVSACALQCQRIYLQIITLIEEASMQVGEDRSKDDGPPAADDSNMLSSRLAVFSKNVTKLGRKMKWPWLEPRIKRCQEHLGRLKASLMLRLLVVSIAQARARPSGIRIFGIDDENEMRRRVEALRKKMTEMRTKTRSAKQSTRQPPGSNIGVSAGVGATSKSTSGASTTSVDTSSSSQSLPISPASSPSASLNPNLIQEPWRPRRPRIPRARRIWSSFKVHIQKRTERKSVFRKDSKSVIFEAYLIYPIPGPFSGNSYPPPIKLPFGHRRLTREIKHTLRKFNPWDILLILSPPHRYLVDRVVQRVQRAATGTSHVCLVAIDVDGRVDVDGYSDAGIPDFETGDLVWTRMVLFFCHEPLQARQGTTEPRTDVIGGRPRIGTTGRNNFLGGWWNRKKRLESQETVDQLRREEQRRREEAESHPRRQRELEYRRRQRENYIRAEVVRRLQVLEEDRLREERLREEEEEEEGRREHEFEDRVEVEVIKRDAARRDLEEKEHRKQEEQKAHDRMVAIQARSELLEIQRQEEGGKRSQREEREDQAEAALEEVQKGIGEGKPKTSEAEHTKKILEDERAKMKANEEKAAAEKSRPPVKFKDAIGRNFSFPFHLVKTWEGMEDLIKQAFLHVEVIGAEVKEGRYNLEDSEGQIILPSLWSATIKPGDSVAMRMWPVKEAPQSPQLAPPFLGRLTQELPSPPLIRTALPPRWPADLPHSAPMPSGMAPMSSGMPPLSEARKQAETNVEARHRHDGAHPQDYEARRPKENLGFSSGTKRNKKDSKDKHEHSKPRAAKPRDDRDPENVDKSDDVGDIDKELGLDDLEGADEIAVKDVDELLETWTNVVGDT